MICTGVRALRTVVGCVWCCRVLVVNDSGLDTKERRGAARDCRHNGFLLTTCYCSVDSV